MPGERLVRGQVVAVTTDSLARVDRQEGCPRLFARRPLPLPLALALATLLAGATLLIHVLPAPSLALDTLASCHAWRRSRGNARIVIGNAIGAAHLLTKRYQLQESPPEAPVALYYDSDLARICSWR